MNTNVDKEQLQKAINENDFNQVKQLLSGQGNVDILFEHNITPLMLAAVKGNQEIFHFLIENNADYSKRDTNNNNVFYYALCGESIPIIQELLLLGSNLNKSIFPNKQYLPIEATIHTEGIAILDFLFNSGADFSLLDHQGGEFIYQIIKKGKIHLLEYLIQKNINLELKDSNNLTPLHWAVSEEQLEMLKLLIGNGLNIEAANVDGQTPLFYVYKNRYTEVLSYLLSKGANVYHKDNNGNTAISNFINQENIQLLKKLIELKVGNTEILLELCRSSSSYAKDNLLLEILATVTDITEKIDGITSPLSLLIESNKNKTLILFLQQYLIRKPDKVNYNTAKIILDSLSVPTKRAWALNDAIGACTVKIAYTIYHLNNYLEAAEKEYLKVIEYNSHRSNKYALCYLIDIYQQTNRKHLSETIPKLIAAFAYEDLQEKAIAFLQFLIDNTTILTKKDQDNKLVLEQFIESGSFGLAVTLIQAGADKHCLTKYGLIYMDGKIIPEIEYIYQNNRSADSPNIVQKIDTLYNQKVNKVQIQFNTNNVFSTKLNKIALNSFLHFYPKQLNADEFRSIIIELTFKVDNPYARGWLSNFIKGLQANKKFGSIVLEIKTTQNPDTPYYYSPNDFLPALRGHYTIDDVFYFLFSSNDIQQTNTLRPEDLKIEGMPKTPAIIFQNSGELFVKGRCIADNIVEFFKPLNEWINSYCESPRKRTILTVKQEFFNNRGNQYLYGILKKLYALRKKEVYVQVLWLYEEEDEDMFEVGDDYRMIHCPVSLIEYLDA